MGAIFAFLGLRGTLEAGLGVMLVLGFLAFSAWHIPHELALKQAAVDSAVAARDAAWSKEIAASNLQQQAAQAAQDAAAHDASTAAAAEIQRLTTALKDAENRNASLPGGSAACLDADRVRLLNATGGQGRVPAADGPR